MTKKSEAGESRRIGGLTGMRVLELASVLAGPLAGTYFAERGARVTKVERPGGEDEGGDVTRSWRHPSDDGANPTSAYYAGANHGKTLVQKDLASEAGRHWLAEELAATDVLIENFKEDDLEKFGLELKAVADRFPQLVRVRLVGYEDEPGRPAYDVVVQAETGYMAMNGTADGPPCRMPVALMDVLASHQIREAALEGLLARTAGYCAIVSLERSGLAGLANQATAWLVDGVIPERMGAAHPHVAPYGDTLTCADGKAVVLAIGNDRQFAALCEVLGVDCALDQCFQHNADRVKNRPLLLPVLDQSANTFGRGELIRRLRSAGVPCGEIRTIDEVFAEGTAGRRHVITDPRDGLSRAGVVAYRVLGEAG